MKKRIHDFHILKRQTPFVFLNEFSSSIHWLSTCAITHAKIRTRASFILFSLAEIWLGSHPVSLILPLEWNHQGLFYTRKLQYTVHTQRKMLHARHDVLYYYPVYNKTEGHIEE